MRTTQERKRKERNVFYVCNATKKSWILEEIKVDSH
jgi:hypothetical protein